MALSLSAKEAAITADNSVAESSPIFNRAAVAAAGAKGNGAPPKKEATLSPREEAHVLREQFEAWKRLSVGERSSLLYNEDFDIEQLVSREASSTRSHNPSPMAEIPSGESEDEDWKLGRGFA